MLSRFGKFHVLKNATGSGLFGLFSDLLVAPSHLILVKLDFCVECCRQSSRDSPLVANYSQTHWSHPLTVKPELGMHCLRPLRKSPSLTCWGFRGKESKSGCFVSREQPIASL